MKRERQDKLGSSKPIVEKERRVLFGIDHPLVDHSAQKEDLTPSAEGINSNFSHLRSTCIQDYSSALSDIKEESEIISGREKQPFVYATPSSSDTGASYGDGNKIDRQYKAYLRSTQGADKNEQISFAADFKNLGSQYVNGEFPEPDQKKPLVSLKPEQQDSTNFSELSTETVLDSDDANHLPAKKGCLLQDSFNSASKHSPTRTVSGQNNFGLKSRKIASVAEKENQIGKSDLSTSSEQLGADPRVLDAPVVSSPSFESVPDQLNNVPLYTIYHPSSTNVDHTDKEKVALESDNDELSSSPPVFQAERRRSSILELQAWASKGAQVKTHVILRRPSRAETGTDKASYKADPAHIVDTMRAFNETRNLKLSESDECETISSSIPNISNRRPSTYFKKLKAFVASKRSKSLGEIASKDISQIQFSAPEGVENNANETTLDSSSESLTDKETAVSARQYLNTLESFEKSKLSSAEEYEAGNRKHVKSQESFSSSDERDDERPSAAIRQPSSHDIQKHTLNVPPSGTVSQILVRNGSVRKRVRTTSETNYSLLRPDIDENHQASSTVVFNRIPSIRHRQYNVCLHHHLHVTPDPDNPDDLQTLKDASHVNPVDTGDVIVTDILSNRLIVFDKTGTPTITFAMEPGSEPWATCLTPGGDLAVTLKRQGCVSLWSPSGEPISEFGQEYLSSPSGIQCDTKGNFLVADEEADEVYVFDNKGEMLTQLNQSGNNTTVGGSSGSTLSSKKQSTFSKPRYICHTAQGKYVVSDSANHCVKIFNSSFRLISQFGSYGRQDGQFKFPYGVASDEDGKLYVADYFNNRVSLFSKDGEFIEHLLTTDDQITRPKGLAVKNGLMYVTYGGLRANEVAVYKIRRT